MNSGRRTFTDHHLHEDEGNTTTAVFVQAPVQTLPPLPSSLIMTTSSNNIVMGERAKIRLQISRLIANRDTLLTRASNDTARRFQIQKRLVGMDDDFRHAEMNLHEVGKRLFQKESELESLMKRVIMLEKGLKVERSALVRLNQSCFVFENCCIFKVGRVCRHILNRVINVFGISVNTVFWSSISRWILWKKP